MELKMHKKRIYASRMVRDGSPNCIHKGRKIKARGLCGSCYNEQLASGEIEKISSGICPLCEQNPRHISKSGKLAAYCKICLYRADRKWKHEHREQWSFLQWKARLKRLFGLSPETFEIMWAKQKGLCGICSNQLIKPLSTSGQEPNKACIDHNHTTNAVRELLCNPCNTSIGAMHENPELLRLAANYLEKYA